MMRQAGLLHRCIPLSRFRSEHLNKSYSWMLTYVCDPDHIAAPRADDIRISTVRVFEEGHDLVERASSPEEGKTIKIGGRVPMAHRFAST